MLPDTWAMDEPALRALLAGFDPKALAAYVGAPLASARKATVRDGVAVIEVTGPLFRKPNFFSEVLGTSSYATIRLDLQAALDDPAVSAIMLNIHSPGGEVAGTTELANAIRDARGTKPIVAYAGDLAASAAYWIASAADRIVIGPGAALGSIGVRAGFTDSSGRDAAKGVKSVEFVSSQSPYKRVDHDSKDGKARIQARIDALADVFVDTVAANRGLSREKVISDFGKGDVLIGKAAIAAGMADEFGSYESVLASLSGKAPSRPAKAQDILPRTSAPPIVVRPPVPAHIAAERARGLAIAQMSAGHEAAAAEAIQNGMSVEAFAESLRQEEAAQFMLRAAGFAAPLKMAS